MVLYEALTKGERERIRREGDRPSLLILDLKEDKLQNVGKEEEGRNSHLLKVAGMNDDLWDRVRGLGRRIRKGCESIPNVDELASKNDNTCRKNSCKNWIKTHSYSNYAIMILLNQ